MNYHSRIRTESYVFHIKLNMKNIGLRSDPWIYSWHREKYFWFQNVCFSVIWIYYSLDQLLLTLNIVTQSGSVRPHGQVAPHGIQWRVTRVIDHLKINRVFFSILYWIHSIRGINWIQLEPVKSDLVEFDEFSNSKYEISIVFQWSNSEDKVS